MKTLRWAQVQAIQEGSRWQPLQPVKYEGRDAQLHVRISPEMEVTIRLERGRLRITPTGSQPLWIDADGIEVRGKNGGTLELY